MVMPHSSTFLGFIRGVHSFGVMQTHKCIFLCLAGITSQIKSCINATFWSLVVYNKKMMGVRAGIKAFDSPLERAVIDYFPIAHRPEI